jgi:hypothetical protein
MGQAAARQFGDAVCNWWGWSPLIAAIVVGLIALAILRPLQARREKATATATAAVAFALFAAFSPAMNWLANAQVRSIATRVVAASLVDADSARIEVTSIRKGQLGEDIACGTVNARARNGAYQGPQGFVVITAPSRSRPFLEIEPACQWDTMTAAQDQCFEITHRGAFAIAGPVISICGPRDAPP